MITLNLCRTPRKQPDQSAYHTYHGKKYDWKAHTMAPPGTRTVVYKDPKNCQAWAPHGIEVWYYSPAFDYYPNLKIFVAKTGDHRISGSFDLLL